MKIDEIIAVSKRLRVGWGEEEKGLIMMIALELLLWQLLTLYNTKLIS